MAKPKKKTTVLINSLHAKSGGAVTYIKNILPHLAADERLRVHVYVQESQRELRLDDIGGVDVFYSTNQPSFWRTLIHEQFRLPRYARNLGADVTYSPANYGPIFAPGPVIMLRNALSVGLLERRPIKIMYWITLYMITVICALSARRVIAVSNYASRQVGGPMRRLIEGKLSIVPHGVADEFLKAGTEAKSDAALDGPDLLAVSDIYVQKNLHTLVGAMRHIKKARPSVTLWIAGERIDQDYAVQIDALIIAFGLEQNIIFLGRQKPAALVDLYKTCKIFVFPSTVETFGNPLVEAMACGACVACAKSAALPEVAGDAVEYFDPNDEQNMADIIEKLLSDVALRAELGAIAFQHAQRYSWLVSAKRTADILVDVAQIKRRAL